MKADSGASKHFIKKSDATILTNVTQSQATSVILPNKTQLSTTIKGTLPLPKASSHTEQARQMLSFKNSTTN